MGASDLMTARGKVIGLGRVKIPKMPKMGFDCEIPLLSFVVIEKDGGDFIATCIHLQIDGYGAAMNDATADMVSNIWYFLHENFKNEECRDSAWENIVELFKSNTRSNVLWDKYHTLQIEFAKKGITTDRHSELYEKIRSLEEKARKLEETIDEKDAYISDVMDSYISEIMGAAIVEYDERAA